MIERGKLSHAAKNVLLLSSFKAKGTFFLIFTKKKQNNNRGSIQVILQAKTCSKVTSVFYLESRLWQYENMAALPMRIF